MIISRKAHAFGVQTTKRKTNGESLDLNNKAKRHTRLERLLTFNVEKNLKKVYTLSKVMSILQGTNKKSDCANNHS